MLIVIMPSVDVPSVGHHPVFIHHKVSSDSAVSYGCKLFYNIGRRSSVLSCIYMPDFAMRLGLDKVLPGGSDNLNEDNLKVLWARFSTLS